MGNKVTLTHNDYGDPEEKTECLLKKCVVVAYSLKPAKLSIMCELTHSLEHRGASSTKSILTLPWLPSGIIILPS